MHSAPSPPWIDIASDGYAALAAHYDSFTDFPTYRGWFLGLEELARDLGLRGRRLLDVGCGTGKSFLPLLELGYDATGCDASPEMLAVAAEKAGGRARLVHADVAALPVLGAFDLVTCLNDVLNSLLDPDDLPRALAGLAANLAPGGLLVFDTNTVRPYRTFFAQSFVRERPDRLFVWRGESDPELGEGELASGLLEIFARTGADAWRRTTARQTQRHHPDELVAEALDAAGLELLVRVGQRADGVRDGAPPDPACHEKAIHVARRRP